MKMASSENEASFGLHTIFCALLERFMFHSSGCSQVDACLCAVLVSNRDSWCELGSLSAQGGKGRSISLQPGGIPARK